MEPVEGAAGADGWSWLLRDSKPTLPLPPSFLSLWLQLARAGTVSTQGAKLLLEVSERVRTLTQAYFSPERPLHLSFTHLVCRTAIKGNHQVPTLPPQPRVPVGHCIPSAPPDCGFIFTPKRL